ncbi:MAG: PEP-CTERM sorting domain-containing protein [Bryobacteraceae bacterium]|jgi:hypothetical protein
MSKFAIVLLLGAASCSAEVLGVLSTGNMLNWDLTVSDPLALVTSFDILGPLSGSNSQVGVSGSDLTATSTELLFNFSGTDHGWLLFQASTLFDGKTFWCNANSGYNPMSPMQSCSNQPDPGENIASTMGDSEPDPLSGTLVIASGGTAVGADTIYDVDQSWTTNGHIFSVTGTVEIGPVAGPAVPEPSMLGFLGLGISAMGFWKFRASRSSRYPGRLPPAL